MVLVTGMHLAPEFGNTIAEVERDGWNIAARIESLVTGGGDVSISASIGKTVSGFAEALGRLRPELLVVYGDRHEILGAVCAAVPLRVPVAHVGGGENTRTVTTDVAYRAAISKLSHVHFVSVPEYKAKLVRMGEDPDRVHVVGSLAVDNVMRAEVIPWPVLTKDLGLEPARQTVVVTYHPVTMSPSTAGVEVAALMNAIQRFPDVQFVFTYPGADAGYAEIVSAIEGYCVDHANATLVRSLGSSRYVSLLRGAAAMLGNSSSGILEAPSLGLPVVNVGSRQEDRVKPANVIDVTIDPERIADALRYALSKTERTPDRTYGDGRTAPRIANVLSALALGDQLLIKETAFGSRGLS